MSKKQKQKVDTQGMSSTTKSTISKPNIRPEDAPPMPAKMQAVFSDMEKDELKQVVKDALAEESVMGVGGWLGQLAAKMEELGMHNDELEVVIGGSAIYGIEGDGTKWSPEKGTRKYNKDSFIVIRRPQPVISSVPGDWTEADNK